MLVAEILDLIVVLLMNPCFFPMIAPSAQGHSSVCYCKHPSEEYKEHRT